MRIDTCTYIQQKIMWYQYLSLPQSRVPMLVEKIPWKKKIIIFLKKKAPNTRSICVIPNCKIVNSLEDFLNQGSSIRRGVGGGGGISI